MPSAGLAGQVALITGGSAGIGRATAIVLAEAGVQTFICARHEEELARLAEEAALSGVTIEYRKTDVGLPAEVDALMTWIRQRSDRLDIVVNAAGILGRQAPLIEITPREWDDVIRTNLTGTFLVCRAAAHLMIARRAGCIITISSGVGHQARAGWGPYAVSKFGVEGLTQTLGAELAPFGIRVFAVNPGRTRTRMRAAAYPLEDPNTLKPPEAVADALLRLIIHPDKARSGECVELV